MFQQVINDYQAPGVEGDFASTNPFSSVLAGPGALVAPKGGLRVGYFFWVGPNGQTSQSFVAGYQVAFLGRNEQALITEFLGEYTMLVPEGFMITGYNVGDFWARFAAGATPGQNVYADPTDGAPLSGASAPALATVTGSFGGTGTGTLVNASTTLTMATVTGGVVSVNDVVTGTSIPVGTTIVAQLTGPAGGAGTYQMSAAATATVGSAEAITTASNLMLVTAVASGALTVGDLLSGTNVAAGTTVRAQVTPFRGVASIATTTALTVTSVQPGTDLLRPGASVVMAGVTAGTTISTQVSGTPGGVGVYTLSAAATATAAGEEITTADSPGATGLYVTNVAQHIASETITVPGTAQVTPFKVRGTYTTAQTPANGGVWKISSY